MFSHIKETQNSYKQQYWSYYEQVVSNNFKIGVYYSFHKERLEQRKFTEIIENCAEKVLGFKIKFIVNICTAPEKADIQEVTTNQNLTALAEEVLL